LWGGRGGGLLLEGTESLRNGESGGEGLAMPNGTSGSAHTQALQSTLRDRRSFVPLSSR
jgi:hypothetical protein